MLKKHEYTTLNHPYIDGLYSIPPIYGDLGGGQFLLYQHCWGLRNFSMKIYAESMIVWL